MISISLDLAALSSMLTVLTEIQLNSAFSCSKQSRSLFSWTLLTTDVGTAVAEAARNPRITSLFIFPDNWQMSLSLSLSLSTRIDPRKIFGAKCDLTLRSFYLYRCSPAGTLPNIPTLTADDACDDDERLRHTQGVIALGTPSLLYPPPRHAELSSIIF